MTNEENNLPEKDKKEEIGAKSKGNEKDKSIKTYKRNLSERLLDFEQQEYQKTGYHKSPEDILQKDIKKFRKYLIEHNESALLGGLAEHLGREVKYGDISTTKVRGGLIFADHWRKRLNEDLDEETNKTYYALVVKQYSEGLSPHSDNWKKFLRDSKLPVSEEEVPALEKGQKKHDWETYYFQLTKALRKFCEQEKGLEKEDIERVINQAHVKNSDFLEILGKKEFLKETINRQLAKEGGSYKTIAGKGGYIMNKEALDIQMQKFRAIQETLVGLDIEYDLMHHDESLIKQFKDMDEMMLHTGFQSRMFGDYRFGDFKKKYASSTNSFLGKLPEERDLYAEGEIEKLVAKKKILTREIKGLKELYPEKAICVAIRIEEINELLQSTGIEVEEDGDIVYQQEFVEGYLGWVKETGANKPHLQEYVAILQNYSAPGKFMSLQSEVQASKDGIVKKGNTEDMQKVMRYLTHANVEKYLDTSGPVIDYFAQQYGLSLDEARGMYMQYRQDIYDPTKMAIQLPPVNGEKTTLYFKQKKIIPKGVDNLAEYMMGGEDIDELFDINFEIDLESSNIGEGHVLYEIFDKFGSETQGNQVRFPKGKPGGGDLTMKLGGSYHMAKDGETMGSQKWVMITLPLVDAIIDEKIYPEGEKSSQVIDNSTTPCFVTPEVAKKYADGFITAAELQQQGGDKVKLIPRDKMHTWEFEPLQGSKITNGHITMLNTLYFSNERERADLVKKTGRHVSDLDMHQGLRNGNLHTHLQDSFGDYVSDSDDEKPSEGSGSADNKQELTNFYKRAAFSNEPPADEDVQYRSEGKTLAWIDKGKVFFHTDHIAAQFGIQITFRTDKKGKKRPMFKKTSEDDTEKNWRNFREMFGKYKRDEGSQTWKPDWKEGESPWKDTIVSKDGGIPFIDYLRSLAAHEKTHRLLQYHGISEVIVVSEEEQELALDQETVCMIVEQRHVPHLPKNKTENELRDIIEKGKYGNYAKDVAEALQGTNKYDVLLVHKADGMIYLQEKNGSKKIHKISLDQAERAMIQTIRNAASTEEEVTLDRALIRFKKRKEHQKGARADASFFEFISQMDALMISSYVHKHKKEGNPFEGFTAKASGGIEFSEGIDRQDVQNNPDTYYVYGDNDEDKGKTLEERNAGSDLGRSVAKEVAGERNGLAVRLSTDPHSPYIDEDLEENKKKIDEDFEAILAKVREGKKIVFPKDTTGAHPSGLASTLVSIGTSKETHAYVQDKVREVQALSDTLAKDTSDDDGKDTSDVPSSDTETNEVGPTTFENAWREIEGDETLGIDDTPRIAVRTIDSQLPGFGSIWLMGTLEESGGGYDLVLDGVSEGNLSAHGMQGRRIHFNTGDDLLSFKKRMRGLLYRFKPITGAKDMKEYIMKGNATGAGFVEKGTLKWQDQYIDVSGGKIMKKSFVGEEKISEEMTYIGQAFGLGGADGHAENAIQDFYRVDQKSDGVVVEAVTGQYQFKQKMDWNTFLVFMADKGLSPYSTKEYTSLTDESHEQLRGATSSIWDHFMSIGSVIAGGKRVIEAFKHRIEQSEKFESAKFSRALVGLLPPINGLYINDIKNDMDTELDDGIYQVITGYKDRLNRSDGDGSSVHATRSANRIEKEIFENPRNNQQYKLRAAGYLLHAVQDQGTPYFRALSKYGSDGMWVRALLGTEHQKEFLKWRTMRHNELKNQGREDEELLHDLTTLEMEYIQKRCRDVGRVTNLYGSKFPKAIEKSMESMGSQAEIDTMRKGIDNKGSIYNVTVTTVSKLKKLEPSKAYAGLENLAQRAEEQHHYHAFYKVLMMAMVSGVGLYTWTNNPIKAKMKQLGRTFGVPFAVMMKDIHHPRRVTRMLDNIALTKGLPPLTEFIRKKPGMSNWDAADLSPNNFAANNNHHQVIAAIDERWPQYGYTVMDSLNNFDESMLVAADNAAEGTKDALKYYQEKVFDKERNTDTVVGKDLFMAALNPFHENGIFNLQKTAFRKLMFTPTDSRTGDMDNSARAYRGHLQTKLSMFRSDFSSRKGSSDPKDQELFKMKFNIFFKRFSEYFGEEFLKEQQETIVALFKSGNIMEGEDSVFKKFKERIFNHKNIKDGVAQQGIQLFLEILNDNKEYIQKHPDILNQFKTL